MLRGVVGAVMWHHYTAAAINNYAVERAPDGGETLTATVVLQDAFQLAQRPLVFVAPWVVRKDGVGVVVKRGEFRWPLVSFAISDAGRMTARLGAQAVVTF